MTIEQLEKQLAESVAGIASTDGASVPRLVFVDEVKVPLDELLHAGGPMEVQPQLPTRHLLHHDIYASIKNELPSTATPSSSGSSKPDEIAGLTLSGGCPEAEMLFGVNSFGLQSFCQPATNNNHETVNHNHSKTLNGRTLTADRKRPYPCNLCPSRFGSKMELEEHQNSHTGMKPFECDVCKARFNRRSTLWNHKRIHSDAKPFVCTVCQMTFKWKNSLKCHKEMHLRKNESSSVLDNDLRQLTYATAAKKRLLQMMEENQASDGSGVAPCTTSAIQSQPLITTSSPKKKASKNNQQHGHALNTSTINNVPNHHQQHGLLHDQTKGWGLLPPTEHPLDLDTSSLDTLVQQSNQNLLVHLCSTDMDRHQNLLGGVDDPSGMLSTHIFNDMKPDVNLLQSHELQDALQFNYPNNLLHNTMGGVSNGGHHINVSIPIVPNLVNIPRINEQQLPSVHHLTSTTMPSVSVNMDYSLGQEGLLSSVAHPQYIVTTQPDIMLSQSAIYQQQPMDQCAVIVSGSEYLPNFDYNMLGQPYPMIDGGEPTMVIPQQQQQGQLCDDGKVLPFDQWFYGCFQE